MRWLVDAQLPPAFGKLFIHRGHLVEHVHELGLRHASDKAIWDYALQNNATIATKDEDFPALALVANQAPPIVWLRIGNCSRKALLRWFEPLLPEIEKRLAAGETMIEIR